MTSPIATASDTSKPIFIDFDGSEVVAALNELAALLPSVPAATQDCIKSFFQASNLGSELAHIEQDDLPALGASEIRIRLKPSDRFLGLMAALRAGDVDLVAVESILHGSGSVGWSGDSNEDRAPGESQGSPGGNQAGERGLAS